MSPPPSQPPSPPTSCAAEHVDIHPAGAALGTFLLVATALVYLPQIHKLCSRKSSEGVQPVTTCLILLYASTNAASTVAMKWKQFKHCPSEGSYCIVEMLDSLQIFVSALGWVAVLLCVVLLPPHNTARWRVTAAGTLTLILIVWATAIAISVADPCGPAAVDFARSIGWVSAAFVMIAFVPQLAETWRFKSAGSLSLIFVFIQASCAARPTRVRTPGVASTS